MERSSKTVQGAVGSSSASQVSLSSPRIGDGASLAPGAVIHQYELIRELGRGGMGVVYSARDTRLGRRVAMKFLLHAHEAIAERFLVEARATARCNHENIVIIHEVGTFDDMPFMVLEFLEGCDLATYLHTNGGDEGLPGSRVIDLMLPVARALQRAHELGIVHRDLKPENVFLTRAGQVKVLDFGIAKAIGTPDDPGRAALPASANLNLTQGGLVGTLPYMSPEQFGVDTVDHRSDLWTFGIMLYEMLVGVHPIAPMTFEHVLEVATSLDEEMPALDAALPDVDPGLQRIVARLLRKRKAERLATGAELVQRLEELLPGRRTRQLGDDECPYPGLTAFQETDAERFFGRSHDVTRLLARVRELPLIGIVGPSGVGKSSLVRAGLAPALKASGESWEVLTLRPGRHPLAALASVITRPTLKTNPGGADAPSVRDELAERLRSEPGIFGAKLRARARQHGGQILVFVDQLEELYTLVSDPDERRAFTAALSGAADDASSPLRVVTSMRSDFLDRVGEDRRFADELSRGLVFLQPLDREGLREAITQPLELASYRFETPQLVDDMLDALGATAGVLPLLQFAGTKLWEQRDRGSHLITADSYQSIGGISGALAMHADEVVRTSLRVGSAEKLTKQIMRQLVTPERTRAVVELSDLQALGGEAAQIVDQLVAARLLVVQTRGDGAGSTVEIVHESLIDRWPTLKRWLDEDHEDAGYLSQLSTAAKQWEARGRPPGLLWRGEAMDEARRWHQLRPRELPPRERAFLDAVFALGRRGQRVRRAAQIGTLVVLGAIAAGASAMLVMVRSAEQDAIGQRELAEREKVTAVHNEHLAADALAKMKAAEGRRLAEETARIAAEQKTAAEVARTKSAQDDAAIAKQEVLAVEKMNQTQLLAHAKQLEAEGEKLRAANAKAQQAMKAAQAAEAAKQAANKKLEDEVAALKAKIANAGVVTRLR